MEAVLYEVRAGAAWLTINRPEKLNSLTEEVGARILALLEVAKADPEVHAVVFTGAGKAFSAGGDLVRFQHMVGDELAEFFGHLCSGGDALFFGVERFSKPTIAAVNGTTAAGGLELILCCDLIFAAEHAKIGECHSNFALVPGAGGTIRLPRRVGQSRANDLLFTGRLAPASEMKEWGLINEVVPLDQLQATVDRYVEMIASKSPLCLANIKRATPFAFAPLDVAIAEERKIVLENVRSDDLREGLAAFNEKRAPRYTGR